MFFTGFREKIKLKTNYLFFASFFCEVVSFFSLFVMLMRQLNKMLIFLFQDDHSITLAFSKKEIEGRKEWLTTWMEEGKRRKELGLPEVYLYEKDTKAVNYTDFVNKELVLFSNMDNERSIPRYLAVSSA